MNSYTHNPLITIAAWAGIIGLLLLPPALHAHDQCDQCHISPTPTEQSAELAGTLPSLCINCHTDRFGDGEHAINVVPSGATGTLPLIDGQLGCTTCHDPHATASMELRLPINELCLTCHPL